MIRVLLADDEQLLREGLRVILDLQSDIEVVAEAADGIETLALVDEHHPDVVVMDIQMPRMDGLMVTERLEKTPRPRAKILILTSFDLDEYLFRALKAGASGFLLKDVPRGQLVSAVRTVAAGDELLSPDITRRLVEEFVRRPRVTDEDSPIAGLTERERAVLRLVAEGKSNREVAKLLFLGEATVKTHLGNVFTKCDLRDRAQAVVLAYETGLVTPGDTG
ncbi:MAG TPA: response regulator transcription factor [Nocardioidaceae bacterium]|nr:response regulator transcription factor [Nocardioidaceae bacterium]